MPLPAGLQTVTVTDERQHPDGGPMRGRVMLTPEVTAVTSAEHGLIVMGPVEGEWIGGVLHPVGADGTGTPGLRLLAADAGGITPTGWTYRVTERPYNASGRSYAVLLTTALGESISLAELAPTAPAEGEYVLVAGPAGPAGADGADGASAYETAVAQGFVGTEAEWLDSLQTDAQAYTDTAVAAEETRAEDTYATQAVRTVAQHTATTPFRIAHRGSGGEFPEHTVAAYEAAGAAGAQAIEISVHTTADGVPVCFHDVTLDRMTDWTGPIASWTYAALRERVKIKAWELLGAGWSDQAIPTLREVLDRLLGKVVIFLEAKSSAAVVPVQNLLTASYPGANKSVVWKNYYTNNSFPWAKANGYTTWGYVDAGTSDAQMDAVDATIDMWGVPHTMTDARIAAVVARGKPVICWEVHRRSDVTRLTGLGVQGLMSSQWLYLARSTPVSTTDTFASQVKAPGDIGVSPYDSVYALKYDNDGSGGAYLNALPNQGVLLGSLGPTPADGYTIRYEMMFEGVPPSTQHAGIAFGKPDDSKYQFNTANSSGGYHIVFRGNGDMQLYTHTAGITSGTQLGTVATAAPTAGQWMTFEIDVTATQVIVRRTDVDPDVTLTVDNIAYRGGYVHLSTGSVDSLANKPHWRNVQIL